MSFETPQDAEDAFYDALDAGDPDAMAAVWEKSADIACLLPMSPFAQGPEVSELWRYLLEAGAGFDIQVRHLRWIEDGSIAIHLLEERIGVPGGQRPPALYCTNVYRQGPSGWRLILHQNSPTPPPPGAAAGATPTS